MKKKTFSFDYHLFESAATLPIAEFRLLETAKVVTAKAYAPYSSFFVGAAVLLRNGKTITGTNQENAASPAGLCAERVALSAASSLYPDVPIHSIAISYLNNKTGSSKYPITPCGICRQTLLEYELRQEHPISLILGGLEGPVVVIQDIKTLLPLHFSGNAMT